MKVTFIFLIKLILLQFSIAGYAEDSIDKILKKLDFTKKIDNQDIVFVPIKNDTKGKGYVWFRNYEYQYTPPPSGENKKKELVINFIPSSTKAEEYNEFVKVNKITPTNKTLAPDSAQLCEASDELNALLKTLSFSSIKTKKASFPALCTLSVKYKASAAQESELLALVTNKQLMHSKFSISLPGTGKEGVYIDVPKIIEELSAQNAITHDETYNEWSGTAAAINYYSAHIKAQLFGFDKKAKPKNSEIFERWKLFMALFATSNANADDLIIQDDMATKELEITPPVPGDLFLEINY